ncbi:hypothetical protein SynPROS71_00229 [Synechococcus sp. PROS-7-1]|nr:hypothetical protein SynPROS71_00229 [Synechococcus sp. PROS-7-1]
MITPLLRKGEQNPAYVLLSPPLPIGSHQSLTKVRAESVTVLAKRHQSGWRDDWTPRSFSPGTP